MKSTIAFRPSRQTQALARTPSRNVPFGATSFQSAGVKGLPLKSSHASGSAASGWRIVTRSVVCQSVAMVTDVAPVCRTRLVTRPV